MWLLGTVCIKHLETLAHAPIVTTSGANNECPVVKGSESGMAPVVVF